MTEHIRTRAAGAALLITLLTGSAALPAHAQDRDDDEPPMNTLTEAEIAEGWTLLFDGQSTQGWRGYMMDGMPDGWEVIDGALVRVGETRDIITTEMYRDFELSLDWKVETAGNSGIFYRAIEGPPEIYFSAPEMQVLDDDGHADGASPLTSAGSNYALHPAPRGVVRPAGEWNTARIVIDNNHVEHWLNGEKLLEYELGSEEWEELVADSKFAEWPEYGQAEEGYIGLQQHGDRVAFRNIKIRVIR
jgi:hypothetical protein